MARAKWGQNFLVDDNVARKCVAALNLGAEGSDPGSVLEIGPGKGALTKHLLALPAARLAAVEIDRDLAAILRSKYGHLPRFFLHNQDFLETDIGALHLGSAFKVISNLPYAVCAPILQKLLAMPGWQSLVVMLQKEVADRICAAPGQKSYGLLSISVQVQGVARKLFAVPRGCFRPAPRVESAVLQITPLPKPFLKESQQAQFFKVVRAAFAHRRKTVLNSLTQSLRQENISESLQRCGIDPQIRAEQISVPQFCQLSKALSPKDKGMEKNF